LSKRRAEEEEEEGRRRKKEEDDEEDGDENRDQKWKMDFGRRIESAGGGGRD
jgi:hypothetical protein